MNRRKTGVNETSLFSASLRFFRRLNYETESNVTFRVYVTFTESFMNSVNRYFSNNRKGFQRQRIHRLTGISHH